MQSAAGQSAARTHLAQVARGLQAMHSLQPRPLIHRDVKPHNVLLRPRTSNGGHTRRHGRCLLVVTCCVQMQSAGLGTCSWPPMVTNDAISRMQVPGCSHGLWQRPGWAEARPVTYRSAGNPGNAVFEKVCMRINIEGGARAASSQPLTRRSSALLQEEAERHATAPYRAPELWDVPSDCTIDERVDSWSLGCLL